MTKKKSQVAVLGAGISGLAAAYALSKKNVDVTVYEKESNVGGAIQTVRKDDWLVEEGPNTLMVKSQEVWQLLHNLNLQDEITEAGGAAKKRYIVKNKRTIPLPLSLWDFFKTDLISSRAKLRLLKEPFIRKSTQQDESIASFISRRLGREPLNYAVNPFVSGIYAGDPQRLSIKHTFEPLWKMEQEHGSLLKGMIKRDRKENNIKRTLLSFKNGNQQLPRAMADALPNRVKTNTTITSATKSSDGWLIEGKSDGNSFTNHHDTIVSTLPAHTLSSIFELPPFQKFDKLPYAPLSVMALGFASDQIGHPLDGFGMLIPEVENFRTLGVLFSSSLFANRVPEGHELLTCFIGGARNPELASQPQKELQSIVTDEVGELLDISGEAVFAHHCFWPQTIPQYEVGYDQFLKQFEEIEKQYKGLFIDGNIRGGVSVPDCIASGFETAENIQTFLKGL